MGTYVKRDFQTQTRCVTLYRMGIPPRWVELVTGVGRWTVKSWVPDGHMRPPTCGKTLSGLYVSRSKESLLALALAVYYWNREITAQEMAEGLRQASPAIFSLSDAFAYLNHHPHVQA